MPVHAAANVTPPVVSFRGLDRPARSRSFPRKHEDERPVVALAGAGIPVPRALAVDRRAVRLGRREVNGFPIARTAFEVRLRLVSHGYAPPLGSLSPPFSGSAATRRASSLSC